MLFAEVVGFKDSRVLLMPFDVVDGIGPGSIVENTEKPLEVKVGDDILSVKFFHLELRQLMVCLQ